jgi:sugar lactone lactonase YvrE
VFTTLVLDPKSAVVRVPLARPQARETLVELSPSGEGKIPDDLAVGRDHKLYVTTYGGGELFRVDPTGRACVLVSGLDRPTSARFGWSGGLFVTQASGSVVRIQLRTGNRR